MIKYGFALNSAGASVEELIKLTDGLTLKQTLNVLSTKNLTKEQMVEILTNKGMAKADAEATVAQFAHNGSINAGTISLKAYTTALWTNIKALGVWATTNPVGIVVTIGAAIAATIAVAIKSYNNFKKTLKNQDESLEKQKKHISELKDKYKSTCSELDDLNGKLEDSQSRLEELNQLQKDGSISLIEENGIKSLKIKNQLLQEEIANKQTLAKMDLEDLQKENRKAFNEEYRIIYQDTSSMFAFPTNFNDINVSNEDISNMSSDELINRIQGAMSGINKAIYDGDIESQKGLNEYLFNLQEAFSKKSNIIISDMLTYQDSLSELMNDDGGFSNPLDQKMWNQTESIKKSMYQLTNRSGEWNTLQFDAMLSDDSLLKIKNQLIEKIKEGNLTEEDIGGIQELNDAFKDCDLILENFEKPASLFIKYLQSIALESKNATKSLNIKCLKDNKEIIDKYQTDLGSLSEALKKLSNGDLRHSDIIDLLEDFPELTEETDNLSVAINKLISDKLDVLTEKLKAAGASDDVIALFNQMTNEAKNMTFDQVLSNIQNVDNLINTIKNNIFDAEKISTDTLQSIVNQYPDLEKEVNDYLQGKSNELQILDLLKEKYDLDINHYKDYYIQKYSLDNNFYTNAISLLPDWVKEKANAYHMDIENYGNLCTAKLEMEKELEKRKTTIDFATKSIQMFTDLENMPGHEKEKFMIDDLKQGFQITKNKAQEEYNSILTIIETVDTAFKNLVPDFSYLDEILKGGNSKNLFDWATNSLDNLKESVDDAQKSLDNTKGFKAQKKAIKELNSQLELLKSGYTQAGNEYLNRFNGKDFNDIAQIIGQDKASYYKNKIMSGKSFELEDLANLGLDNETESKLLGYINQASSDYRTSEEMFNNAENTKNQIRDNNLDKLDIEESELRSHLNYVNEQLNNETLSITDKNKLLDEQYQTQVKLNDIERQRAKREKNWDEISKLNEEDKNNNLSKELEKAQGKIDDNQLLIDNIQTQLENSSLSESDKSSLNNLLNKYLFKDFKLKLKFQLLTVDQDVLSASIQNIKDNILSKEQLKNYDSDFDIIMDFLPNILSDLNDPELYKLYYEQINSKNDKILENYNKNKDKRGYWISGNNNNIADIENEIAESGGRGTVDQYAKIKQITNYNKDLWEKQKADALIMRDMYEKGSEGWNNWNNEVQECENNIHDCNIKIKECNVSILSLPLNSIQDRLNEIQTELNGINYDIDNQNILISAANGLLDRKINKYETLKKKNQDQINILQKENSLRKSNLEVSKAEYELQKLRGQKTQKVFREGIGWVFEADEDALRSAQESYDDAVFNNKIAILQNQNDEYDIEISKLNDIKKVWSEITTKAQTYVDLARAKDMVDDFKKKVLSGNVELTDTVLKTYKELSLNKTNLEAKQYDYQTLQSSINDTIEKYKLEAITFKEAKQDIKNVIETYCPGISGSYKDIMDSIDNLKDSEDIESDNVKNKTDKNKDTIEENNIKIFNSYNTLLGQLNEIFGKIEGLITSLSGKSKDMASSIAKDIINARSQLLTLQNGVLSGMQITSAIQIAKSGKLNNIGVAGTIAHIGESHTGMELGYVSKNMNSNSSSKDDFQVLCLDKLEPNEILRKLEIGESVITANQRDMIMSNFNTMANTLTHIPLRNVETNKSIAFNGDIVVNGVNGDINAFAKAVKNQLPNALLQELHK